MSEPMFKNWSGHDQVDFSYSLASDLDKCGYYTKLTRIQGLSKKVESAAFKFGICIEQAVQSHYLAGSDPEKHFSDLWDAFSDVELDYSSRDGGWGGLLTKGRGLMREFLKQKPGFPDMRQAKFQEKLRLDGWMPRANLIYIADAIVGDGKDRVLIDMKTAAASYPEDEESYPSDPALRWLAMDPQLRTGCLVSGIRKVAFMVFVKNKEPKIQWLEATVSDELVADVDLWLKAQYQALIDKQFFRRAGWRFPSTQCSFCDVSSACMGNDALAKTLLKQRESKSFDSSFE
jgi:hypothetical protein